MREAALRSQCSNNLRQIGLAVHNYNDGFEVCPPGTIANEGLKPDHRLSWLVAILPFMEKNPLWKEQVDATQAWDARCHDVLVASPVRVFGCPSEPHLIPTDGGKGLTTYVGIAGLGVDAGELPRKHPRAGFFGYDRQITLKDVEDGASNTLMVLEIPSANGPWAAGGSTTVRGLDPGQQPYIAENGPFGRVHRSPDRWQFSSLENHPLAVIGDASVRSIAATTSAQTLEAISTIAGKETLGSDW